MQKNSETFARKLSTGNVMLFDKETRELYLIEPSHAGGFEQGGSVDDARKLVDRGGARRFSRDELSQIQEALAGVVLLV